MPPLVDRYRAFAIDLDGVVWRGSELLPGVSETITAILERKKPLLLLTNNGSYDPKEVIGRVSPSRANGIEVLTSTLVAIRWVREHRLEGATCFVVASPAVSSQISEVLDVREPSDSSDVEIVLVGRDLTFDFNRLTRASDAVRRGAHFLALNRDATMPVEGGGLAPGTGAILAAVEAASGRRAIVLGKPQAPMMEAAVAILGREEVLLVGDRLDSDIQGAKVAGWDSALVMSGVTPRNAEMTPAPDYVIDGLPDLLKDHQVGVA